MNKDKFLKVAKQAAIEAGKVLEQFYGRKQSIVIKNANPSDVATAADTKSEEVIIKIIKHSFPNHNIVAEESGRENRNSDYTWVIDPIDGTTSFIAQIPVFAVSIALLYKDEPILGVVNLVVQKKLIWAEKNKGSFVNDKRIRVSKNNLLANSLLGFDFGKTKHRQFKLDKFFLPLFNKIRSPYIIGASVISLCYVALGMLDGFMTQANIWDIVGAALIVEEAGGKVTDPDGKQLDWTKHRLDLVASNNLLHNQIIEVLQR